MPPPPPPTPATKGVRQVALYANRAYARDAATALGPLYAAALAIAVSLSSQEDAWTRLRYAALALALAAALHALVKLLAHWFVRVKLFLRYTPVSSVEQATAVHVCPAPYHGRPDVVPIDRTTPATPTFTYRSQRFVYDDSTTRFRKHDFNFHVDPRQLIATYGKGYSNTAASLALDTWGTNTFNIPQPTFQELLAQQMLQPFFVFQVFCVALWLLDAYWYYALFTLALLVFFECTVVYTRQRTAAALHKDSTSPTDHIPLLCYRAGKWTPVPRSHILPGDVVSLCGCANNSTHASDGNAVLPDVPADCLLLAGIAVASEAMLTGESTPQWKAPVEDRTDSTASLRRSQDKRHILFKGTTLVKHERASGNTSGLAPRPPDGGCTCLVLRTGFGTSQGKLMRSMLFRDEQLSANSAEAGIFILMLLGIAVVSAAYVVHDWTVEPNGRPFAKVLLMVLLILTSVVPPELPMELSLAVNQSLVELMRLGVYCTEPFRIPFAGKCDTCCFDKTGTLTSESLVLHGVVAADRLAANKLVTNLADAPAACARALGACHALTDGTGDHGDPLDLAGFAAVHALFVSRDRVVPCTLPGAVEGAGAACRILKRFHFASELRRMSVVCRVEPDGGTWVLTKGAPETVAGLLDEIPKGYDAAHEAWSRKGARVIALAAKRVDDAAMSASRDECECNLQLLGLAVFECPLKPDSAACLASLAASKHRLVMITGDAPLAACHVARHCEILPPPKEGAVFLLDVVKEELRWTDLDGSTGTGASPSFAYEDAAQCARLARSDGRTGLCVSGAAIAELERRGEAEAAIVHMRVLARTNPRQKALMIAALRARGRTCLMCGDGTNDVGALRGAQVGVALLGGPSVRAAEEEEAKRKSRRQNQNHKRSKIKGAPPPPGEDENEGDEASLASSAPNGDDVDDSDDANSKSWLERIQEQQATEERLQLGVTLRDASLASPFTVRGASVRPCLDVIRSGRTTLVTTLQMFKILGLQCLCGAYGMSVMYVQGVRLGDSQATFSGACTAGLFFCLSKAKPLEELSAARPHSRVFTPYLLISMAVQFVVHLAFTIRSTSRALDVRPEGERVCVAYDLELSGDAATSGFEANTVNSACYIVGLFTAASNFAVNYVGHPHSTPLFANTSMVVGLAVIAGVAVSLSLGAIPDLNEMLEVSTGLPDGLGEELVMLAVADFAVCYAVEHALRAAFPARVEDLL